jgi:hypothetical protein
VKECIEAGVLGLLGSMLENVWSVQGALLASSARTVEDPAVGPVPLAQQTPTPRGLQCERLALNVPLVAVASPWLHLALQMPILRASTIGAPHAGTQHTWQAAILTQAMTASACRVFRAHKTNIFRAVGD